MWIWIGWICRHSTNNWKRLAKNLKMLMVNVFTYSGVNISRRFRIDVDAYSYSRLLISTHLIAVKHIIGAVAAATTATATTAVVLHCCCNAVFRWLLSFLLILRILVRVRALCVVALFIAIIAFVLVTTFFILLPRLPLDIPHFAWSSFYWNIQIYSNWIRANRFTFNAWTTPNTFWMCLKF